MTSDDVLEARRNLQIEIGLDAAYGANAVWARARLDSSLSPEEISKHESLILLLGNIAGKFVGRDSGVVLEDLRTLGSLSDNA